jgi:TRAP-type C4-dicarboxylate transport system substrate-binding protein
MVVLKIQEQKKYISNIKIIKYNNNFYVNKNIFNKLDNKTLYFPYYY